MKLELYHSVAKRMTKLEKRNQMKIYYLLNIHQPIGLGVLLLDMNL